MSSTAAIAAIRHAVPYLALFRGKTFVVKVGGAALDDPRTLSSVVEQVAALHHLGIRVVLVHGGGRQASEQAEALGLPVRLVAGRRVTDDATLAVVTRALNGDANTALLSACRAAGLPAAGVCGVDGGLVTARRRGPVEVAGEPAPVDYGHVGDVVRVEPRLLRHLLDGGFVPVVSPLGADPGGRLLNLNADAVAAALAVALSAEKLLLLVEPAGILEDPADPRMRASGSLRDGMLPKAAAIEAALQGGVPRAHLISWRSPDALLWEIFSNEGSGTLVVGDLAALTGEERDPARELAAR
jgi:acetylglutamate kinase